MRNDRPTALNVHNIALNVHTIALNVHKVALYILLNNDRPTPYKPCYSVEPTLVKPTHLVICVGCSPDADTKPLLSHSTTGETDSLPNYYEDPEPVPAPTLP
eukprot:9486983-Pyramimonas_sp.AAC.2